MSIGVALACIALAFVGSAVQSSLGVGFGLLASPILALIDTDFVPGAVLVAVAPLTLWIAIGSFAHIDHRSATHAVIGRLPGVVAGAVVVRMVSDRSIAIALGCAVLIAIAMSVWLPSVAVTPARTFAAGSVSGFMGTATGVGGPPMVLLYQRGDPVVVRATLSAYFFAGTILSIIALAIAGGIGSREWRLGALLVPGVVAGIVASRWLRPRLRASWFRPCLLAVSAGSAIALLVKQV